MNEHCHGDSFDTAQTAGTGAGAPGWFEKAIAVPAESRWVEVEGARIHYLAWPSPAGEAREPLLLVHGNTAHARWWQFVAPFLADQRQVVALDLGGIGDSDHRATYTPDGFAAERCAVTRHAGLHRPILIGHSFGGSVCLYAASREPEAFRGLMLLDSAVRLPAAARERRRHRREPRAKRVYADFETALSRFRLMPEQPCANAFLLDFIGRHSLRQVEGGWTWKFDDKPWDRATFGRPFWEAQGQRLNGPLPPAALLWGSESALVTAETAAFMRRCLPAGSPAIELPEAQHHLMLDQPLALVAALRALLAAWPPAASAQVPVR